VDRCGRPENDRGVWGSFLHERNFTQILPPFVLFQFDAMTKKKQSYLSSTLILLVTSAIC